MNQKSRKNLSRNLNGNMILLRAEGEDDNRQVQLSFSSEEPYQRWFGPEILSHEEGAADLSRLQDIGVLLWQHRPDAPIGKIIDVSIDTAKRRGVATVQFDEDELSDMIYQKVLSGTLKGVSVGYDVSVWESVSEGATSSDGRFTGPCDIAKRWTPYEISIVSLPADPTVGVNRQLEEGENDVREKDKQNEQNVRETAVNAERTRVNEIVSMCRSFNLSPDDYISKGTSVEDTRAAILTELAAQRKPSEVSVTADESEKFRAAATDGLALRAGVAVAKPADGAEAFRGKRMLRLAAECLEREKGVDTRKWDDEMLVREALTGTGAFPGILSNVANKSLAQAYATAPTTFQHWTSTGSNSDFKQATRYRLSEADTLEPMTENGEFKNAEVSEGSVITVVGTYGRSFAITRKAIIDDDLGALSQIPSKYGAAAKRGINKRVYALLKQNPLIEGAALFDEEHNNLTKGSISVTSLGAAKALMARQTNLKGEEALNVQPAYLIVPPELEVVAAQLVSSAVDPTKSNATPNPFANRLTVVSDPELTDAAEWYLAAAPGILPSIEVTYLNGKETPTVESAVQFDTLGIKWRVYLDFGVNLIDFRGLLKSSGKDK